MFNNETENESEMKWDRSDSVGEPETKPVEDGDNNGYNRC